MSKRNNDTDEGNNTLMKADVSFRTIGRYTSYPLRLGISERDDKRIVVLAPMKVGISPELLDVNNHPCIQRA
jgi:hypothetical protein